MRVFFTGGSGKAGRHAVAYLRAQGHHVINADQTLSGDGTNELQVDLMDFGQVIGAMSQFVDFDELNTGQGVPKYDAVVHFAAVPRVMIGTDGECFKANTQTTYNVIEAAVKLGIPKVIFASSETTYAVCFADGEIKPDYVPIDESHPTVPHDSYAMSKVCNEMTAKSFQARTGIDIYGLRINNVIEPHEYARDFPAYETNARLRRRNIFAYIDARDLGHMVDCCLKTDGLGYQIFNVANEETSVGAASAEVMAEFYHGVPETRQMGEFETFYDISKAKKMVGFQPKHNWRSEMG
jgi:nucleoside-diphosphate-sugar epimerase